MLLPSAPTNAERDWYAKRHLLVLTAASILAFTGMAVSMTRFALQGVFTVVFLVPIAFMIVYFVISLLSNSFTRDFDLDAHEALTRSWRPDRYPSMSHSLCKDPGRFAAGPLTSHKNPPRTSRPGARP
jgi:cellulose synthase (UDP-forming)